MNINRHLLLLWLLCFLFITISLIYKFSESPNNNPKISISNQLKEDPYPIEPSQNFYNSEITSDKSLKNDQVVSNNKSEISAKAYIVGNVDTGQILLAKKTNAVLPVASMSKLITAIASIDRNSLLGKVSINESELSIPDSYKFKAGENFTVNELLYPLLLNSSNIAAEALASSTNRIDFMNNMSSYAWEIGMPSTYFADPSGISPTNMSSAIDFFALAQYLYKSRSEILSITKIKNISIGTTTDHEYHEFTNIHPFVSDPRFMGGKTGHTEEAKDTMLTIMNIKDQPIAIIVLASENRKNDTQKLIQQAESLLY